MLNRLNCLIFILIYDHRKFFCATETKILLTIPSHCETGLSTFCHRVVYYFGRTDTSHVLSSPTPLMNMFLPTMYGNLKVLLKKGIIEK